MKRTVLRSPLPLLVAILCIAALLTPAAAADQGKWWEVVPEAENPSPNYDSILYSEIAPKLREIEVNSNRVKVDVIGQSAGGRDLFLVTLSDPQAMGRLGQYRAISRTMLEDPEKAQEMIEKFGDFKVPIFINGSIHGGEYPGVDTAIRLIETLAYDDSDEVQTILDNVILLVNVVQNPDGRVQGTRSNANGFDINRDFASQTQSETRATVEVFTEWNPMVVLDLHGFVNPMLIEPCTPPHNPNYEYDLYIKWALAQAEAMEAELLAQTGFTAQIPYRDFDLGWDDWPPSYTPMYAMYHGAYGHTLETPYRDQRGVDAQYAAVWGALEFIAANREDMIHDQVEIFRRGFLDLPQQPVPPELLPVYDQYLDLMLAEFPAAYIIPADEPFQPSAHQAVRLVDFLLFNGVEVEQAVRPFSVDEVEYPAGTYVVWLDQPKRGLANTILEDGLDLSSIAGLYFYSPPSVWSHPLLWGARRAVVDDDVNIKTVPIAGAGPARGSVDGTASAAYRFEPSSIAAFQAVNALLARGEELFLADGWFAFGPDVALAREIANGYALDVEGLSELPTGSVPMVEQRIAVYGDEGVAHALESLGFAFDEVGTGDLNAGVLAGYDLFVNQGLRWSSLNAAGKASALGFFAAGGDYVALPDRGRAIDFANDAGIVDVDYGYISGNAIIEVDYSAADPIAAGFLADDYAFVYRSVWFADYPGMEVTASIGEDEFLVSGFWEDWQTSGAAEMPIVIHNDGIDLDVTLIGVDATFRGHPENTFRLLGNAIFSGLD